ncbi:hypothetical protein JTB14_016736 [Gonioctena quinquepunctata]|nr:hypothetical protein JTB14_016736 [Gonioctena quinquepunctata]
MTNDCDSEEDGSEPSDYEEHSDEETEEASSEIGEDSDSEEELKKQNNENARPWCRRREPNNEEFRRLPFTSNSKYKPSVNGPETELEVSQFFLLIICYKKSLETNRFGAEKIQKATPLQKNSIWHVWENVTLTEMEAIFRRNYEYGIRRQMNQL